MPVLNQSYCKFAEMAGLTVGENLILVHGRAGSGVWVLLPRARAAGCDLLELLKEQPGGLKSRQIIDKIIDLIESNASNRERTITSAIYSLKKSGKITHNESTGIYKL